MALSLGIGVSVLANAQAVVPVLENPSALRTFVAALRESQRRVVRISVYGASHVAPDIYTGTLRELLQQRFGNGGLGTFFPLRPFSRYAHRQLNVRADIRTAVLSSRTVRRSAELGRAGFVLELRAGVRAELVLPESVAHEPLQIALESSPSGGVLEVVRDGVSTSIDTRGAPTALHSTISVHGRRIEVSVSRGPVRLLGFSLESDHGVVVEAFGVPSSRVSDALMWDENAWQNELRRRPSDLLVLAYGTNEVVDGVAVEAHVRSLQQLIQRVHNALPSAACWVVGPSDRPQRAAGGWRDRIRAQELDAAYRHTALSSNCAYSSMLAFQGGLGSMNRWVNEGLADPDHVHWTNPGYTRFGRAVYQALSREYDAAALDPSPEER